MSAEVAEERARTGLVWVMLDRSAVEVHDERARVIRLEYEQLVGPAVELEEQKRSTVYFLGRRAFYRLHLIYYDCTTSQM
jgi:hypothetical protein